MEYWWVGIPKIGLEAIIEIGFKEFNFIGIYC
jgi:hypothetical protein